jgi:sarcosine oxidase
MPAHDLIVVGLGGHGASVFYHAAARGLRVLGLERFDIGHAQGSSHGVHRLLRLGYAEGRSYVPLLLRAVELYRDLEARTGVRLFIASGVLSASPGGRGSVEDARTCSEAFGLRHEMLGAAEINRRFPAFAMAPDMVGLFQPDSGFVMSEATIAMHVLLGAAAGGEVRTRVRVLSLIERAGHVEVETDVGRFEAGAVVLAAGAFIGDVLPALAPIHKVMRRALGFFSPKRPADFAADRCPGYTFGNADLSIYGFPIHGFPGVKIGRDGHLNETGAPDALSRETTARDEACLREGVRAFLRDCDGPLLRLQACILNDTPDKHFIIDRLPGMPNVHVVSMCSGHGFKFTAVTGEIVLDRIEGRPDSFDLTPFRLDRFAAADTTGPSRHPFAAVVPNTA